MVHLVESEKTKLLYLIVDPMYQAECARLIERISSPKLLFWWERATIDQKAEVVYNNGCKIIILPNSSEVGDLVPKYVVREYLQPEIVLGCNKVEECDIRATDELNAYIDLFHT